MRRHGERPTKDGDVGQSPRSRRVLLVAQVDGYANGVKSTAIEAFLRAHGHDVTLVNTYFLSRASTDFASRLRRFPRPGLRRLAIYASELAGLALTRRWRFGRRHLSFYVLLADFWLRRSLLADLLPLDDYDLVLVSHPQDAGLLTAPTSARTFYDCQTPWADELYYEEKVTEHQRDRLRRLEARLYGGVDGLAFSWESYAAYVIRHYGVALPKLRQINWGCVPVPETERARYADPPRVIYLGSLSSRFIDLPLLTRLSRLYPIDVYGGPPPDPQLGLNYCGWAPPTVLGQYQLGLITCTQDELRRDGFSAKNLHYISYGLPVLVPAWRRQMDLLRGHISYEERTFVEAIASVGEATRWQEASDEAYGQAQALTWDQTLAPLQALLQED
jgi:hypothetical protein